MISFEASVQLPSVGERLIEIPSDPIESLSDIGVNIPKIDAKKQIRNFPESTGSLDVVSGWVNSLTFSSTDEDTVAWNSGNINLPDGTVYSITSGNTGNMSAITYIYLDTSISETVLQTSTNPATAYGSGKLVVAVAQQQTAPKDAIFQIYGNSTQNEFITADNIASNVISANEIFVTSLSSLSANIGTVTAGTILGNTIKTATSGKRVEITGATNTIRVYDTTGTNIAGFGYNDGAGSAKNILRINQSVDDLETDPALYIRSKRGDSNVGIIIGDKASSLPVLYVGAVDPTFTTYYSRKVGRFENESSANETVYINNRSSGLGIRCTAPIRTYTHTPESDGTYDLGSASLERKDLYIDGVAYLDKIDMGGDIDMNDFDITNLDNLRFQDSGGGTDMYMFANNSPKEFVFYNGTSYYTIP